MQSFAFIVRPFGEKKIGKEQALVNFDDVEKRLIQPALSELKIAGSTTAEILESGNIRHSMFQLLLLAELVIADLSIDNANVFYELGIRHALREKRTFLLNSRAAGEPMPFDVLTDRYLAYDHTKPEESREALVAGLRRTLASDSKDSPIFAMLPSLRSQDPGRFMVVPPDFRSEVDEAKGRMRAGVLALLAAEVSGMVWEREGLRLVAQAQSSLNLQNAAADTWNRLLRIDPKDCQANLELGTIYRSAGDLDKSNASLQAVLDNPLAESKQSAAAHALRGRNATEYWRRVIAGQATPEEKQLAALRSPRLEESFVEFRRAFEQDLSDYCFGVEALARLTVWVRLAQTLQKAWASANASATEARRRLAGLRETLDRLTSAVEVSMEIAERQAGQEKPIDLRIARAQLTLLTSDAGRVNTQYVQVAELASPADLAELGRFLAGFLDVGVLSENVQTATGVLDRKVQSPSAAGAGPARVLLYRGYGRELLGSESKVSAWIRSQIEAEFQAAQGKVKAIAGGACGGDILFHEICQEMRIPAHVYLPFAREQYVSRFVQSQDPQWVERFGKLATTVPLSFLQASPEMPDWLVFRQGYTFLQRWNSWMLWVARSSAPNVTLIAICDETRADEEGVLDLVLQCKQTGVKVIAKTPGTLVEEEPK